MTPAILIERARERLSETQRNDPGNVADEIMRPYKRVLRLLPPSFLFAIRNGLVQSVMARLKAKGVDVTPHTEAARQAILALWTDPAERKHVEAFGDAGCWVPFEDGEGGSYRSLTPDLTPEQLEMAGEHLIVVGDNTKRKGHVLKDLAAVKRAHRRGIKRGSS